GKIRFGHLVNVSQRVVGGVFCGEGGRRPIKTLGFGANLPIEDVVVHGNRGRGLRAAIRRGLLDLVGVVDAVSRTATTAARGVLPGDGGGFGADFLLLSPEGVVCPLGGEEVRSCEAEHAAETRIESVGLVLTFAVAPSVRKVDGHRCRISSSRIRIGPKSTEG